MDFFNADAQDQEEEEDKFAAASDIGCVVLCTAHSRAGVAIMQGYEAFRENVLFLIDTQPAMLAKTGSPVSALPSHTSDSCVARSHCHNPIAGV